MKYFIREAYDSKGAIRDAVLEINNDVIDGVSQEECHDCVDLGDRVAVPSFVDIHTHGISGIDSYEAGKEELLEWEKILISHGVQFFVPTIVSAPIERIKSFLKSVREAMAGGKGSIVGGRLEGPLISKKRKGAHKDEFLVSPVNFPMGELLNEFQGVLRIVDIAPELEGSASMINNFKDAVIFSLGHTDCTTEECLRGIEAGSNHVTHLFNAMRPFHHRDPGLIGLALSRNGIIVELITDMVHLAPETIKMVFRCKKLDDIVIVTDSISAASMPDGSYRLGELEVEVANGIAKIKGTETIAGSTSTMDKSLKNMASIGFSITDIIGTMTYNPSKVMGIKHGLFEKGYRGRVTLLDRDYNVMGVLRNDVLVEDVNTYGN